jgi:hypothetical protein
MRDMRAAKSVFCRLLAAWIAVLCLLTGAAYAAPDVSKASDVDAWLQAPMAVSDDMAQFVQSLAANVAQGPEPGKQSVWSALQWIGYARLRFEVANMQRSHDLSVYNAKEFGGVGMRETYNTAKKLESFRLWNILQLAASLRKQFPGEYEDWRKLNHKR